MGITLINHRLSRVCEKQDGSKKHETTQEDNTTTTTLHILAIDAQSYVINHCFTCDADHASGSSSSKSVLTKLPIF